MPLLFVDAVAIYRKLGILNPSTPLAKYNEAAIHIRNGRFNFGWQLYDKNLKSNLRQFINGYLDEETDLWDGEVNVLQVTDTNNEMVETRALMSAIDSPTAWDLRVHVREKLVIFIQENYPHSLPRTRVEMQSRKDSDKVEKATKEPDKSDLLRDK